MTGSITIVLPLPPNLSNSRFHWRTRLKAKKDYLSMCELEASQFLVRVPWHVAPEKVQISAHFILGGRSDIDNLFGRLKFPLDFLVRSHILKDDSPKHLEWASIPTQEVTRKKPYSLTLTLTPIDP